MRLTSFHTVGTHRQTPRVFLENTGLLSLGFKPGTPLRLEAAGTSLTVTIAPAGTASKLSVSRRQAAGYLRPVIDLNSFLSTGHLTGFEEIRVRGSHGRLLIEPSIRAANIATGKAGRSVYRVLDVFAGGGTASDAFAHPRFKVVAGIEIMTAYADEFARKHPDAEIISGDFGKIHPSEIPEFDGVFFGLPCTNHSNQGRTKNRLARKPELGEVGALFVPALGLVAARMPAFAVFECIPNYGNSLAGLTLKSTLRRLGYHVTDTILDPNNDYAELSTRRRWVCVATLRPDFTIPNPHTPFTGTVNDYLDPIDPVQDEADATRIAQTIVSLKSHGVRHGALGHRLGRMVTLDRDAQFVPTVQKSYHKINTSGAFIATPYGERMIRPSELCRIHGHTFTTEDSTTIYQMSGQGVLTRVFATIANELAHFLP